jgi:hypothetical protein
MAITTQGSGTQTAVISTEHTLLDIAVAGSFVFEVDANAMASGDTLELRIYKKVLSGGTLRVAYMTSYTGAQSADDIYKISVPFSNDLVEAASCRCTLKQTAGTGRAFPWKVIIHS